MRKRRARNTSRRASNFWASVPWAAPANSATESILGRTRGHDQVRAAEITEQMEKRFRWFQILGVNHSVRRFVFPPGSADGCEPRLQRRLLHRVNAEPHVLRKQARGPLQQRSGQIFVAVMQGVNEHGKPHRK